MELSDLLSSLDKVIESKPSDSELGAGENSCTSLGNKRNTSNPVSDDGWVRIAKGHFPKRGGKLQENWRTETLSEPNPSKSQHFKENWRAKTLSEPNPSKSQHFKENWRTETLSEPNPSKSQHFKIYQKKNVNWDSKKLSSKTSSDSSQNKGYKKSTDLLHSVKDNSYPKTLRFGLKEIYMLLNEKDCDEIVLYIYQNAKMFELLLKEELGQSMLELVVKLIVKTIDTKFIQIKLHICLMICEKTFIDGLVSHIIGLTDSNCDASQLEAHHELLNNLLIFFKDLINFMPQKAMDSIEVVVNRCKMVTMEFSSGDSKFEVLFTGYRELKETIILLKGKQKQHEKETGTKPKATDQAPPNDFREISIFPTTQDLMERNFIRENKLEGSYIDVFDYLDVQFRLLREDFIDPLRVGINLYKESLIKNERKRNFNVRIYKDVRFINIYFHSEILCRTSFTIQLKTYQKINWENSKRLLFNSLCLLSIDNFESFLVATVSNRNIELLRNGQLDVDLVGSNPFGSELFNMKFVMAESSAFFDPVYQTLNTLQMLPTDALPMENYILVKDVAQKRPTYLISKSEVEIEGNYISIDDDMSWQKCVESGFNNSQCEALKAALTSEFCVIQGPPGTGKTYLGINLVKILLANIHFDTPILMLCYTNHALDQFLQGLLPFTRKIVRIGGQSKSECLNKYNLKTLKKCNEFTQSSTIFVLRQNLLQCSGSLTSLRNLLNSIEKRAGIIDLLYYKYLFNWKVSDYFESNEDCLKWLLCEKYDQLKDITSYCTEEFSSALFPYFDMEEDVHYLLKFDHLKCALENNANNLEMEEEIINMLKNLKDLSMNIIQGISDNLNNENVEPSITYENLLTSNMWSLSENDRWVLYHYWIKQVKHMGPALISEMQQKYSHDLKTYQEFKSMENFHFIKELRPKILGLTTTGAARLHNLISALRPAVIVVEEAAEVLEAHIVASLTDSCQHLILIGDHKQLRPNPSTFKLAKDYNLDISFFERMIRNGVGCSTLQVQHRMKPNIASLISPLIYPDLQNDQSVERYPLVLGVVKNLFFINHKVLEREDKELESHQNCHEAEFLIALCRYLLQQGYCSEDITILTTYASQQFYLRELKKRDALLRNVRMTVVDNYQGEECKIILLSLVRSNEEGSIGFIGTENRICVALSRAKHGLYIIGNMDLLKSKSDKWMSINNILEKDNAIGEQLALACQTHDYVTYVSEAKHFNQVQNGGCKLTCDRNMPCAHKCTLPCHPDDWVDHRIYKCNQPCNREICYDHGYTCLKKCHEKCPQCTAEVEIALECGHKRTILCYQVLTLIKFDDVKLKCEHPEQYYHQNTRQKVQCPVPCNIRLDCGHACGRTCHLNDDPDHLEYKCLKDCTKINASCQDDHPCQRQCFENCGHCLFLVKKTLPCGHTHDIACSQNIKEFRCNEICRKTLPCGHSCDKKCKEFCDCSVKVKKTLPCGHTQDIACSQDINKFRCIEQCTKTLPCGHKCHKKCFELCDSRVYEKWTLFSSRFRDSRCRYKCSKVLQCGHACSKECSEPCDPCVVKVDQTLSCGHTFNIVCSTDLNNFKCKRYCLKTLSCGHKCVKKCFQPCDCLVQMDKVIAECGHTIKASCCRVVKPDMCRKACERLLPCGHLCKLKCGDDCRKYKCKEVTVCSVQPVCGHLLLMSCYENARYKGQTEIQPYCKEPCKKELPCKHLCMEECSRCQANYFHKECEQKCEKILICGHKCPAICSNDCQPCQQKCLYKCQHSKCNHKCGDPCVSCKERCLWACKHMSCTKLCGEECDREPCYEPCDILLPCGHPCVGFCGEPCPSLCRICNREELTEYFFGNESNENARFVALYDCEHIFESEGLEYWLNIKAEDGKDQEIGVKGCPKCKTLSTRTLRFSNFYKRAFKQVNDVTQKILQKKSKINTYFGKNEVVTFIERCLQCDRDFIEKIEDLVESLESRSYFLKTRSFIYLYELRKVLTFLAEQTDLTSIPEEIRDFLYTFICEIINYFRFSESLNTPIKIQLNELKRLRRMMYFCKILLKFNIIEMMSIINEAENVMEKLLSCNYSDCEVVEQIKLFTELNQIDKVYQRATDVEMQDFYETMKKDFSSTKLGHWFKCCKGHLYVLTNPERLTEKGFCPECKLFASCSQSLPSKIDSTP